MSACRQAIDARRQALVSNAIDRGPVRHRPTSARQVETFPPVSGPVSANRRMPPGPHRLRLPVMSTPRDAVADCLASVTDGTLGPRARRVVTVGIGVCVSPTLIPVLTESSLPAWARVVDLVVAVASVVIAAVVLYRRPVTTAVAMSLLAAVSPAATPLATAALIVVAIRYRLRLGLPIAALGVAAHVLLRIFRPIESLGTGWWLLLVVAVYAALLGISLALANYLALVRSLRDRAERAEAEQEWRVAQARRAERDHIARDMHDVLAHRLSLLPTHAGALEDRPDASPDRLAAAAAVVRAGGPRGRGGVCAP